MLNRKSVLSRVTPDTAGKLLGGGVSRELRNYLAGAFDAGGTIYVNRVGYCGYPVLKISGSIEMVEYIILASEVGRIIDRSYRNVGPLFSVSSVQDVLTFCLAIKDFVTSPSNLRRIRIVEDYCATTDPDTRKALMESLARLNRPRVVVAEPEAGIPVVLPERETVQVERV